MSASGIRDIEAYVTALEARIKELEEGSCRFNCRTMKEAFMAGWAACFEECDIFGLSEEYLMNQAYRKWKDDRDSI